MNNFKKGFTLIEVLLVLLVISLLSLGIMNGYSNYNSQNSLKENGKQVKSIILETRSNSISQKLELGWQIELNADNIVLQDQNAENKRTFSLPQKIQITNISLNSGGNIIAFDKMTGNTTNYGTGSNDLAFKLKNLNIGNEMLFSLRQDGKLEIINE
ncbi:hypothetical protein COZ22_01185 [bacterium (Candidatus Howlettbacteria) CG_4_10_14_3_um_filter_37_10]|nr:MAG: hypothetical protein COX25_05635 [bacterium (Candidatus Howlettbacteria) CG23_combo_of_CG06-09_8_20_14_all_37_9]PIY00109.1 MAG: hypothetical protein COZ22_01185 [bacterium (Candidatus Howlettbacteria) CG_4_10_14_3_um_filter_37_10]PJB06570.1 MAG: hypothetical protein CO123_01990 [bacterium (Candidatus Howlettbacteria) CG_4_9_14_3_um_filter_37_10]